MVSQGAKFHFSPQNLKAILLCRNYMIARKNQGVNLGFLFVLDSFALGRVSWAPLAALGASLASETDSLSRLFGARHKRASQRHNVALGAWPPLRVRPLPRAFLASLGARRPLTRSCPRRASPCSPSRCSWLLGLARLGLLVRRPRSRPGSLRLRRALAPCLRGALAWSLRSRRSQGRICRPPQVPDKPLGGFIITTTSQKSKAELYGLRPALPFALVVIPNVCGH